MPKNLLIVESPAKAKTIEKYLGGDFKVLSSVGHIRKDTKVDVANDFAVTYEIDPGHKKVVAELKKVLKDTETVWLATDEDREGESISWHLAEVLGLPKSTHRITFHEITATALKDAIAHPRTIDMNMVYSQQARQTLDMIVGFDLSGVIRRKVPGAISAGRVQSPALRLVVEKEREIEKFDNKFNFKVAAHFDNLVANLEKTQPSTTEEAKKLLESLAGKPFTVTAVDHTEGSKANPVPLTTAAMQIEASSKLGFSAVTTMRAAQALYQAGYITYHRTDSLNLSSQAIAKIAEFITAKFGPQYLQTRKFKTKSAGAQEAHEAIRPTDITKEQAGNNNFEQKLYQLIRSRTLATQMTTAKVAKTTLNLAPLQTNYNFTAKGEVIIFDGFLKVYGKSKDLELPDLKVGDQLDAIKIIARQTFAKPPARYTEGSLVKKLEELSIGRPSTYASIMSALQARGYVVKGDSEGTPRDILELTLQNNTVTAETASEKSGATKGKLLPTPVGELVSDFLVSHFTNIVDYGFTAEIETKLDLIAEAKLDKLAMLKNFYGPFAKLIADSGSLERFNSAIALGTDPATGKPIFSKIGKNGGFIQLGENEKVSGEKPRFAPLPDGKTVKTVTFEQALKQLELPALPRTVGFAPDKTELIAASGPFGPYLKAGQYNVPLKQADPYTISLADATKLYQEKLDSIIANWGDIMIIKGAYGPYIKGPGRRNNLKIPKDQDPTKITQEQARAMLEQKGTARKSTAKTTKARKTTATATIKKSTRHKPHARAKATKK